METQLPPQDKKKKYIFLDTCIIQYIGDKNISKSAALVECLDSLVKEGYNLAISEITIYEHLQGLSGSRASQSYKLLSVYDWKAVSRTILFWATWLGGFYHDEKIDGIDTGDKIIAATAVSEAGFVLTANHKDYPHPFFLTEKSFALTYKVGQYTKTLDIALYKPDFSLLARRLDEQ